MDFCPIHQTSEPTALGTRLLTGKTPGLGPPLTAPKPARRPHNFRSVDEDIRPAPPPPIVVHANSGPTIITGRPLASNLRPASTTQPPAATSTFYPSGPPKEDYIPIIHRPSLSHAKTRVSMASPPIAVVIPPTPSDEGFTPITPTPTSPRLKEFRLSRAPPLPRDALGIPVGKKFFVSKSKRAHIHGTSENDDDDTMPLSPASDRDLETQMSTKQKPKRKTLWGVIEGWWDLGLLERGKSLRRKT
ncbi:hypothetical protein F5Y06DRAFT_32416 [Hypoxylon sp. FL0890]|nr:hypothetical protein F5Y06DRAFT_32416 [Hypoxylon sp. FL0890]